MMLKGCILKWGWSYLQEGWWTTDWISGGGRRLSSVTHKEKPKSESQWSCLSGLTIVPCMFTRQSLVEIQH